MLKDLDDQIAVIDFTYDEMREHQLAVDLSIE